MELFPTAESPRKTTLTVTRRVPRAEPCCWAAADMMIGEVRVRIVDERRDKNCAGCGVGVSAAVVELMEEA